MSKMWGLSVKVPFVYSNIDGPFELNQTMGEVVKQNLKNVILTNPGERIMIPDFGVGLNKLLFEGTNPEVYQKISSRIYEQVNLWLPYLELVSVEFMRYEDNPNIGLNELQLLIAFNLGGINIEDSLTITATIN
jgi:phage baseplate assembly protein W